MSRPLGSKVTQDSIISGQIVTYHGDPFTLPAEQAVTAQKSAILIKNGLIAQIAPLSTLRRTAPHATVHDHGDALISPGFIDAHAHYPQTGIIASWGKRLIDWLNTYTFPEEQRFADTAYAREIANLYLDFLLSHGTTTVASFCTIHPESVDALFKAAQTRGMRIVAGKTCMDRDTAPQGLRDTAQTAYDQSKALLNKWHGKGRATYAITPRFSPTSTPEQLEALGALWAENPSCLMQTHLSEQTDEIAWVKSFYPNARDYLDTYETYGLIGKGALFGHAIHLEPREIARLQDTGSSLIHCPTSNTFIGSGLFNMAARKADGLRVGLATDTGGGSSFSMLRTMAASYEIGQLTGTALHPAQLLWLATKGSAEALHMGAQIGSIAVGMEADLTVIDLASTPEIAQRSARAQTIWESVFPTIMMGDDRAISKTYVMGIPVA
ncbi:guanine deaminase [Pacificibacter marinus]|uniref:Guanine deaminase n=1 Tax=Pacificibacter marinus TaxID=658057 RepID=A0A1Y5SK65_9RHOB|nr:guanine deaminase [Pacificibacter marinus]SEK59044.1 guanine deaminase [Pacificibacter marinus]SLN42542.1 Guanine deaminase [Pacificibacter marinus]